MVDGKPVYYIYNQSDLVFSGIEDIGFLGLIKCTRISVEGLTMDSSNWYGILLVETTDSSIVSSTFSNSIFGIRLFECLNNTILDCKTSGEDTVYGIELLDGSSNNSILDCEVKGGILFENAPFNILRNNTITGDYINFQVFGNKLSDFYQDVDDSNTINGKPIYYFIEEDNLDIYGSDIGYLGFVNCTNVKIHDIFIQYNAQGVLLANTDAVVENCELLSCCWGVHLFMCSDVNIIRCNFKDNFCGVYLQCSSYNQVLRCDLSNNWWHGCLLENSDNNLIKHCDVYFTGMDAFFIENSYDNDIHYNNIDGSVQSGLFAISSSVNATLNWWGSATGPGGDGPGYGDELVIIDSTVLYEPWLKSPVVNSPDAPIISGSNSGKPDILYTYSFTSIDPNEDQVSYYIDWDDGSITNWTGFQPSGTSYTESHTWTEKGTYTIRAKARDTDGYESEWRTFNVEIPRTRASNQWHYWFLERFPILLRLLFLVRWK